jgi:hypothetical protein
LSAAQVERRSTVVAPRKGGVRGAERLHRGGGARW